MIKLCSNSSPPFLDSSHYSHRLGALSVEVDRAERHKICIAQALSRLATVWIGLIWFSVKPLEDTSEPKIANVLH